MPTERKTLEAKIGVIGEHANTLTGDAILDSADKLQLLAMIRDTADSALANAVALARQDGMTWDQVGRWTGTTRQAAQQKYR